MPDSFTIKIFVPDGDPEGVRIIERMNWTGRGIIFPREDWSNTRHRSEFEQPGIYILRGYGPEDEDKPVLYIGQTDSLKSRIDSHIKTKDFWDSACVFVSTNNTLNRGHTTWIEYALVDQARRAGRSNLYNNQNPQEPSLSEAEKADTEAFLKEVLQILPLVGLHAFEEPKPIVHPQIVAEENRPASESKAPDTIIVPAQEEGFQQVFLGENAWYAIRISGGMRPKIKWIAAYQIRPISAITHIAEVASIEPYGDAGKFKVNFAGPVEEIGPIKLGDNPNISPQAPRYTTLNKLKAAKTLADLGW